MKKIGIVICNYNKKDYVVNCIRSVLDSSFQDMDVYVVDNASTDGSAEAVEEEFGDRVRLIVNQENLGGAGGFDTGLRELQKHDYQYFMLMDNDIVADRLAVEELYRFMEEHPETGMAGSKVFFMDDPERIWGFGGIIDYDSYTHRDQYRNCRDSDAVPDFYYCDYVAACSLIVRAEAVGRIGVMPEENFIYWDDMEWGYRFNEAGYKVAVYGKSKIWHKAGGRNAGNTFIHYYMWRNRIRFFMKVLPEEKLEAFAEAILSEMFRMIYSVNLKGEVNIIRTLAYAFDDAVHGRMGRAQEYKILPRPQAPNRVETALEGAGSVLVKFDGSFEGLGNIIRNIRRFAPGMRIGISAEGGDELLAELRLQYPDCIVGAAYEPKRYDRHLVMCSHIFRLTRDMPKDWYIDPWCNIIFSRDDFIYAEGFEQTRRLFVLCRKELLLNQRRDGSAAGAESRDGRGAL